MVYVALEPVVVVVVVVVVAVVEVEVEVVEVEEQAHALLSSDTCDIHRQICF